MTDNAAPVPVAFLGRTSTLMLQDPAASIARQYRTVREWLPPGWFVAASFWDIESGGLDLEARGHGSYDQAGVTVPRDGGLADLLAEAASPVARFAAVICEDIERSGRDTFNALRLERELSRAGVALFATDEPADIAGASATTVLVRRVKQGVAEWFRLQIKEKTWKGLQEHSLAGWNVGPAPYAPDRTPHPVAYKAAQGRTKTRLALNPSQAPAVAAIYAWRTEEHLGVYTITSRLNADQAAYPPPTPAGWTQSGVGSILRNPKYTGHMVFGRHRTINGKTRLMPRDQWLWSPQPTHPAIITRATWEAAQTIGALHSTSRDDPGMNTHPAARRTYALRGRIRCRACQHRMSGITRTSTRPGTAPASYTYYVCPPSRHRDPDHPRTVSIREDALTEAVRQFLATRILAAHLAAQIPATADADTARRRKETDKLTRQLHKIDAAENAHAREIEALTHHHGNQQAITALRTRLIARFGELEAQRATINTQLATLTAGTPDRDTDPGLLDALPLLGDILDQAPGRLQQQLYDAFGIQVLYRHHLNQVTIYATITDTTPATLTAIISDSDTPARATPAQRHSAHATTAHAGPAGLSDLSHSPIRRKVTTIMVRQGGALLLAPTAA
ncbi:MAG TPA: recombinase family protein [Streptosporangiaceae bacterium]|nr:recombinase family protein [Streptosporangiaceae bacterium]